MKNTDSEEIQALLKSTEEKIGDSVVEHFTRAIKGIIAGFTTVACLTISAVSVQLLQRAIPDFELNLIRFLVAFPFCCVWLMWKKQLPWIPRSELTGIILYCFIGFATSITYFTSVSLLPAATTQSTVLTAAILSGIFVFAVFLKDKPGFLTLLFAGMSAVGAIFVIQPSSIFGNTSLNRAENNDKSHVLMGKENITFSQPVRENTQQYETWTALVILLPISCGVLNSVDVLVLKKYPYLGDHIRDALFWTCAVNIVISGILMVIIESPVIPSSWKDIILSLLHSIFSALTWPIYFYVISAISGNTYNLIWNTSSLFQLVAQYTILSSILPGHRNWIEVLGVVLVTLASVLGSLLEIWKSKNVNILQ